MQKHSAAAQEAAAVEAVKHSSPQQEAQAGRAPQQNQAAEPAQPARQAVSPETLPEEEDVGHLAEIRQQALPPLDLAKPMQAVNSKPAQSAVPDIAAMPGPVGTGTAFHASAGLWQNAQASLNLLTCCTMSFLCRTGMTRCFSCIAGLALCFLINWK